MYRIIYVSEAKNDISAAEIGEILDTSQSNNHERLITGFLAHKGRHFMQAIEGARDEVFELYQRILSDARHSDIEQIVGEHITARAFPDWAMNYFRVDEPRGRTMIVRRDDPVDGLLPKDMPRELLYLFTRFLHTEPASA